MWEGTQPVTVSHLSLSLSPVLYSAWGLGRGASCVQAKKALGPVINKITDGNDRIPASALVSSERERTQEKGFVHLLPSLNVTELCLTTVIMSHGESVNTQLLSI
ncbi:hypothetical protein XELAEV_18006058mg [Xenopus laevis]|uniref:Uncharacterized protein n=1 Tax=Xenopus laevis TaxID=8355 RepID=A0A974DY71_XENLA|nr:hypothetical protein XELAEV_18006058mg [Xenopus laevis]